MFRGLVVVLQGEGALARIIVEFNFLTLLANQEQGTVLRGGDGLGIKILLDEGCRAEQ